MKTEIGFQAGVAYYLGDLNEVGHFKSGHTHRAWGFVLRQPISDRFAWKNSFVITKLSGNDADSELQTNQNRNLSFSTKFYEFSSQIEFNFFRYHSFVIRNHISPYIFTGMSFFRFNPTAELNGNEYNLREFRTEGQADMYKRLQFALPFGAGIKFKFSHRIMFALEYGLRKTFTDYLDDVSTKYPDDPSTMGTVSQALSNRTLDNGNKQNEWGMQRGNSQRKDLYAFTTFSVVVRLGKNPNLCKYNTQ
jgi:hypothetical protein